jgi:hypothetical protein
METYAMRRPPGVKYEQGELDIHTLLLIALNFLAWSLVIFLAWRAIKWLRTRRKFDGRAVGREYMTECLVPDDLARELMAKYDYDEWTDIGASASARRRSSFCAMAPRMCVWPPRNAG